MFYEGRRRERERERERVVVVVKVVVECALVLKKKKEDDCDEINCRLVFFLHSVLLLGNCESSQKGQKKRWCVKIFMIKGSTFARSLQTNNV
jgi:hypothetical protein